jgi:protease I
MAVLDGKKVAILADNGVDEAELLVPRRRLREAGATVEVIAPQSGRIRLCKEKDWGDAIAVNWAVDEAVVDDYDALVLPGVEAPGIEAPGIEMDGDGRRRNESAVQFVRDFCATGKPVAAIDEGERMLVAADVVKGKTAAGQPRLKAELEKAGAHWVDRGVVDDHGLITGREPGDLDAFVRTLIEELRGRA